MTHPRSALRRSPFKGAPRVDRRSRIHRGCLIKSGTHVSLGTRYVQHLAQRQRD